MTDEEFRQHMRARVAVAKGVASPVAGLPLVTEHMAEIYASPPGTEHMAEISVNEDHPFVRDPEEAAAVLRDLLEDGETLSFRKTGRSQAVGQWRYTVRFIANELRAMRLKDYMVTAAEEAAQHGKRAEVNGVPQL